jgi:hypothetical protein
VSTVLGRSSRAVGRRVVVDAGPPRRTDSGADPRWGRIPLGVAGAVVIAETVAAIIALTVLGSRSGPAHDVVTRSDASSPDASYIVAAVSWADHELPHGAAIVADPRVSSAMTAQGFRHLITADPARAHGTEIRPAADYVVSTEALRRAAATDSGVQNALRSSVPVAAFGSGTQGVVVRQVSKLSAAKVAALRSADRQSRRTAEHQLLANPAVLATGTALSALRQGELDIRCAAVLALMASTGKVELISVDVNAAEQAAGLPARTVDVRSAAPLRVQALLEKVPPAYRPIRDVDRPNGAHRMTWPIDPTPSPVLN